MIIFKDRTVTQIFQLFRRIFPSFYFYSIVFVLGGPTLFVKTTIRYIPIQNILPIRKRIFIPCGCIFYLLISGIIILLKNHSRLLRRGGRGDIVRGGWLFWLRAKWLSLWAADSTCQWWIVMKKIEVNIHIFYSGRYVMKI